LLLRKGSKVERWVARKRSEEKWKPSREMGGYIEMQVKEMSG